MELTRRCDYALRMLRAIYRQGDACRSVAQIAEEENIPYSFARGIQHELVRSGLVCSTRGAGGGVQLCCDLDEITIRDIFEIVQGPVSIAACSADPTSCGNALGCGFNKVWRGADKLLNDYLASITLGQVLKDD